MARLRRSVAAIVTAVLFAGCSVAPAPSSSWRWTDPDVHVVDGYYVGTEYPCPLPATTASDECRAAVEVATAKLAGGDPSTIVAAATANPPRTWVDANGKTHGLAFGGLMQPRFAVLTLGSGVRRAIALSCGPAASPKIVQRVTCSARDLGYWRVGRVATPDAAP